MKVNQRKGFFSLFLAVIFIVAGILGATTVTLADSETGNDNRTKSFTVQDSDPTDFVMKGGITDTHVIGQAFPIYVFITNNGQTKPLDISTDVDLTLTLKGPTTQQTYELTIPEGNTYGTVNITCPEPGAYTISIESNLDGQSIELETEIFTIGTAPVSGLIIEPGSSTIPVAGQENLIARLVIPELHIDWDVTHLVWWSSDNSTIASVENWLPPNWAPGLVSGISPGVTSIRATLFGIYHASAQVVVTQPSLVITPVNARVNLGSSQQFYAYYRDGVSPDLIDVTHAAEAVWTTDNPLNPVFAGLITPMQSGTTMVTVTYHGLSQSASLNVVEPTLTLSGTKTKMNVGEFAVFQAFYSDATEENRDVTTAVDWASDNTSTATIGLHTGEAQGIGAGTAVIKATYGGAEATVDLTVVRPALVVQLEKTRVNAGTTVLGKAVYTDAYHESGQDVTALAAWSSSAGTVAKILSPGSVEALSSGTANILANYNGLNAVSLLTVVQPQLTLLPDHAIIGIGENVVLQANYSDAETTGMNVSNTASWSSSNPTVASVSLGTVNGVSAGSVVISAVYNGTRSQAQVTVLDLHAISRLSVEPLTAAVDVGGTVQYRAWLIGEDGSRTEVTDVATWSSSTSAVTVASDGTATGVSISPLPVTITAVFNGISGTAALTVSPGGVVWEAEERP